MITFDQRLFLVFTGLVLIVIMSINNLIKYRSFEIRVVKFLQLLVLLFPIQDLKLPPGELNIKLFEASIATFSLLNFSSLINIVKTYENRFIWIFLGTMILSSIVSEFIGLSLLAVFRLALVVILFFFFKVVKEAEIDVIRTMLIPIFLWALLFFLMQLLLGLQFTLYQNINENALRDLRYTSFSQDPQKLAQIIFMLTIIFLADVYQTVKLTSTKYWGIILTCIVIGLSTGSRAALLGFVFSIIWMFLNKISKRSVLLVLSTGLFVVLAFERISTFTIFQRMINVESDLEGRNEMFWAKGFMIFKENIWFGVGPGNFLSYVTAHHNDFTYGLNGPIADQPESGFLLLLCESGIMGAIIYLILLLKVLSHKTQQNGSLPFKLSIVVWIIGFITVYSWADVKVLFLFVLGIAMVLSSERNKQQHFKKLIDLK